MSFLHPWFLAAALAAAVPLVLHLLLRRRARDVRFSSLVLLRLLQQKRSRRLRLAQLLLLLVRMSAVALVALLFAQPMFERGLLSGLNAGPQAVVVLADTSRSMGLRGAGGETLMQRLRSALGEELQALDPRAEVAVVNLGSAATVAFRGQAGRYDPASLEGPGPGRADVAGALALVPGLLERTAPGRRRVVVLSDFQDVPWREALPALARLGCPVRLRRLERDPFVDWGLVRVEPPTPSAAAGSIVRFAADLVMSVEGRAPRGTRVVAEVDGRAAAAVSVAAPLAGPVAAVRVEVPVTLTGDGWRSVRFRLDEDDLPDDDELVAGVSLTGERTVVLLDGAPSAAPLGDEVFFLRKVYGAPAGGQGFRVRTLSPGERPDPAQLLAQATVVHVAAWPALDEELGAALWRYMEGGGTVALWGGDTLDVAGASRRLLQPACGMTLGERAERASGWVAQSDADTPLGHLLQPPFVRSIASRRYLFVGEPEAAAGARRAALRLDDGTPLLVAAPVGAGYLVFFNASADQDWSSLPLHPLFPVLVSQLHLLSGGGVTRVPAGQRVVLPAPSAEAAVAEVRSPRGLRSSVRAAFVDGKPLVALTDTAWPGPYEVTWPGAPGAPTERFEVLPDGAELRLTYLDAAALASLPGGAAGLEPGGPPSALKVTDLLLVGLLLLLVAEGLLVMGIERAVLGDGTGA